MGCTSSNLLNQDDDFTHHIVSLTSTTYGLLTLDDPSSPPRFTLSNPPQPEVINSWELMAGLDSTPERFNFTPQPSKPSPFRYPFQENTNPNHKNQILTKSSNLDDKDSIFNQFGGSKPGFLDGFEELMPSKGENKVVVYTTSLRGVRKTYEACNAVRRVLDGFGVVFSERDISMDRGFREELWELMKGKDKSELVPPRVFVKGRYVGGSDEVLKIVEEGCLGQLLNGLPKSKPGYVCETCGGARFLPCCSCNGSCKVVVLKKDVDGDEFGKTVTVKCTDCNENGLVQCPVCS